MLRLLATKSYKKGLKKYLNNGYKQEDIDIVVDMLIQQVPLPSKYKDHKLKGNMNNYRECHIKSDWLLVYKVDNDVLTLTLVTTGTHSEIFKM